MPAEIIKIDSRSYSQSVLERAARIVAEGGLAIFPTETVYGLGTNANILSAVKRLRTVKNSPEERPFTFHLASAEDAYCHISDVPRLGIRLMRAYWPGPLTLVLPDSKGGWTGLRVPDHQVARDLIKLSKVPVIASSANIAEQTPPSEPQAIIKELSDRVDIIIDAGTSGSGVSSSVVRVAFDNKFEVLREGSISADDIRRFTYKMIVFICSGNTCRSPMAMGLYRKMLADRLRIPVAELEKRGYRIISAGTSAIYNSPASSYAVEVMAQIGVDINDHLSQPVTLSILDEADEIYVMGRGHLTTLKEWAPELSGRIKLLDPNGSDIEDPIAVGVDGYRNALKKIRNGIERIL